MVFGPSDNRHSDEGNLDKIRSQFSKAINFDYAVNELSGSERTKAICIEGRNDNNNNGAQNEHPSTYNTDWSRLGSFIQNQQSNNTQAAATLPECLYCPVICYDCNTIALQQNYGFQDWVCHHMGRSYLRRVSRNRCPCCPGGPANTLPPPTYPRQGLQQAYTFPQSMFAGTQVGNPAPNPLQRSYTTYPSHQPQLNNCLNRANTLPYNYWNSAGDPVSADPYGSKSSPPPQHNQPIYQGPWTNTSPSNNDAVSPPGSSYGGTGNRGFARSYSDSLNSGSPEPNDQGGQQQTYIGPYGQLSQQHSYESSQYRTYSS